MTIKNRTILPTYHMAEYTKYGSPNGKDPLVKILLLIMIIIFLLHIVKCSQVL